MLSRAICTGAPGKERREKGEEEGEPSEEEMWKEERRRKRALGGWWKVNSRKGDVSAQRLLFLF